MPKKEKIREMFDNIATDYDKLNHIMSLDVDKSWRRKAIRRVMECDAAGRELKVLDIACGTGDFSIAMAKSVPSAHITGLDISEGMLAVMKEKVYAGKLDDRISIMTGDGENLPFEDDSFDCVTIAFGIRNFESKEKGLREMLRVLKPGGRLVVLELSMPENPFVRWCFSLYFLHVTPSVGGRISGDKAAYRYLPASVVNFPKKEEFLAMMSSCGFRNIAHKAFTFGICRMYLGVK